MNESSIIATTGASDAIGAVAALGAPGSRRYAHNRT
jgi:hypothetical protein